MEIFDILNPPNESLFYSRGEKGDIRMGDIVLSKERDFHDIDVAIIGVPQDEGVKRNRGRAGAKDAPDEIRKYLYKFTPFNFSLKNQITSLRIFDLGNLRTDGTLEDVHESLAFVIDNLIREGIIPVVLGGGHDIAFPDYLGFAKNFKKRALINIDAHLDVRDSPLRNSGTPFRQILELDNKLKPEKFFEIGIQSYANSIDHFNYVYSKGVKIILLDELRIDGVNSVLRSIQGELNSYSVFASFDMDSVRCSDAPGVSASYPDGLSAGEILKIAHFVGRNLNVKLIDIAEVNPKFDIDGRTAKLAGILILNFLSGLVDKG
jgi:formimidoylglutamase